MTVPIWFDDGSGPVLTDPALLPEWQAGNVASLWLAASAYEAAVLSGASLALIAIGVSRSLPISTAVLAWDQSIWALYYSRKPTVAAWATPGEVDLPLFDFSSLGPCLHTVPEIAAEVNG